MVLAWGCVRASTTLHFRCVTNVLRQPIEFFDTTPTGRIINRLSKDVDTIDTVIPLNTRIWLFCSFQVLATLLVLSQSVPWILVLILPLAVLYICVQVDGACVRDLLGELVRAYLRAYAPYCNCSCSMACVRGLASACVPAYVTYCSCCSTGVLVRECVRTYYAHSSTSVCCALQRCCGCVSYFTRSLKATHTLQFSEQSVSSAY